MAKRKDTGKNVALASVILNVIIFAVKGVIGIQVGSLALLSDAVHSITDSASSGAVYLGLAVGEKPPDEKHPYGHGRAEQVAVLVVGIILFIAALSFFTDGIETIFIGPERLEIARHLYLYILLTAIAKEVMGEVSYFVGKKRGSEALKADAWHHRADAITTMLVIGALYGSEAGILFLDPLVGIGIAFLLGYLGISYVKKSASRLLGDRPSERTLKDIKMIAKNIPGVKGVHNIRVHDYGDRKAISLHMESEDSSLRKAHERSHQLKKILEERFGATAEIHFDPKSLPEKKVRRLITNIAKKKNDILDVHKIRITEDEKKMMVSMHLLLPKTFSVEKGHEIGTDFEEELREKINEMLKDDVEIQVHIEPCQKECEECERS